MNEDKLNSLRKEVDALDKEMIGLLKKRFKLAIDIWEIKKPLGMKIKNSRREKEIIDRITRESGFNRRFVKKLCNIIFKESRRIQREAC